MCVCVCVCVRACVCVCVCLSVCSSRDSSVHRNGCLKLHNVPNRADRRLCTGSGPMAVYIILLSFIPDCRTKMLVSTAFCTHTAKFMASSVR